MSVVGEHYDPAQLTIDHATFRDISGKQCEFLSVAAPVHGHQRAGRMNGFVLRQDISVMIKKGDDAGVLPEIGNHELQAGRIRAIFPHTHALRMAHPHLLEHLAARVENHEALVAA